MLSLECLISLHDDHDDEKEDGDLIEMNLLYFYYHFLFLITLNILILFVVSSIRSYCY